ncbi:energy-coupling factor ABC transporter permease [Candidatus Saganbacteria bacterium]|nr:energy-coupling factor ABC transporter permease [Candidatus Saganbacteria bacterium]
MHIPDGFLDPKVSSGLIAAAAAALSYSISKVREAATVLKTSEAYALAGNAAQNISSNAKKILSRDGQRLFIKMGMVASLIFIAQMIDFRIGQSSSGHLFGGVFASILLGPYAGSIVMSLVLAIQAIFLHDGGLISLGANIINMAVIGAMLGYGIYFVLKKIIPEWTAILIAGWASVVMMSIAGAIETGIYSIVRVHLVIGIAEALITLALVNIFRAKTSD